MGYMNADGKDEYMGDYRLGTASNYMLTVESDGTFITGHNTLDECQSELSKYSHYNALLQVKTSDTGVHANYNPCDWQGNVMPVRTNKGYNAWLATAKIA